MNCCESTSTDCEQGRLCPKRDGHPIPIELLQLPSRRRSNRLRTLRARLLTTLIILAAASALGLVAHFMLGGSA